MKLAALLLGGLLASAALLGCGQAAVPGVSAPVAASPAVAVSAMVHMRPRRLETLVSTYAVADIDHVVVVALRGGVAVPGATNSIPRAALGGAVTLGNLRLATTYQLQATAYADAAGTQPISVDASSLGASFTTPAVLSLASGDTVNETPLVISVPVGLGFKTGATTYRTQSTYTYTGQVALQITAANSQIAYVEVSLLRGGTAVTLASSLTYFKYTPASLPDTRTVTLTQLMKDSSYQITVKGFKSNGHAAGTAGSVTFNTNAVTGAYEDRPTLSASSVTL